MTKLLIPAPLFCCR